VTQDNTPPEQKTAKILSIGTGKVVEQPVTPPAGDAPKAPISPQQQMVIDTCESLLKHAKEGTLVSIAGVGFIANGNPISFRVSGTVAMMYAQASAMNQFSMEIDDKVRSMTIFEPES
jgi:hypothetical protein